MVGVDYEVLSEAGHLTTREYNLVKHIQRSEQP
jgi:hypothetical protein